jgi:hypothetical protein
MEFARSAKTRLPRPDRHAGPLPGLTASLAGASALMAAAQSVLLSGHAR